MIGKLLDTREAASLLGLSPATLSKLRHTGKNGPQFLKLGRRVVYDQNDLLTWLAGRRRKSTSAPTNSAW